MSAPRFFFDITSTARWRQTFGGGITRVEQELARRARKFLGAGAGYCLFDKAAGRFRIVRDEYAARVLADTARLPTADGSFADTGIRSDVKAPPGATTIETVSPDVALGTAIELDSSVTVISTGHDWIDKDVRTVARLKAETGFGYVSAVHDLTPVNMPQYLRPGRADLMNTFFATLVRMADACICISKTTVLDLKAYCEKSGVPAPPALAFPLGSNFLVAGPVAADLPGDLAGKNIVLMVSTLQPRKNHRTAYEAWYRGLLAGAIDPDTDRLVFVGGPGWRLDDLLSEIALNPVTGKSIVVLENISDAALQSLYRAAALVILPSFYEGYGLPLAEAFSYGKVCVTSGAGALSEIGTGFRIDVDPRDIIRWSATISELLRDPAKRSRMEATIRQSYKPTTWDMSAEIFFAAVRDLAPVSRARG